MTQPSRLTALERMLSSWTAVLFFLACFAISQSWILMTLGNTGEDVGKLQTMCLRYPTSYSQTGTAARKILQEWTSQDILNFQRHFLLDLWIHPILYALFFASGLLYDLTFRWQDNIDNDSSISISKATKQSTTTTRILYGRLGTVIVFGAALCDILENIRHHSIQFQFEPNNHNHVVLASDQMLYEACVFASTKWLIMGAVSIWLIWRYFYSPSNANVSALNSSSPLINDKINCNTTCNAHPDDGSWRGPLAQDFLNSPGKMGLLDVQGRKIPWTLTHPNSYEDVERSYTVSPYAHYIGYALDEIPLHLAKRPILSFFAKALVNAFGYIFHSLCFDDCIYFNNFRLSTNIWPGGNSIEWSQSQVEDINQKLQSVIHNNSNHDNRQAVDRAIVWRSVDPLSQPELTKVLSESPCLMIPARVVNWTEFQGDFKNSNVYQKKTFQRDMELFRNRVGWDILQQESTAKSSTAKYIMATLEPNEMTIDDAIQIVDLYNQLYIDKYSRRNPQLTPEGVKRLAQNGFFSVDVLRLRATTQTPGQIVGFCTWSVVDDIASSAFIGYDIAHDHDKDLYRLVMMMIHSNLVRSGVKKCHMSGGANYFKRRRGASSTIECNAVFVDHLPYYQQIPWMITKRIAGKVITVDRAK